MNAYLQDLTTASHTLDHHEELLVFYLSYEFGQAFVLKATSHHEHRKSEKNYWSLTALWHISLKTQVSIFHTHIQRNFPDKWSIVLHAKVSNEAWCALILVQSIFKQITQYVSIFIHDYVWTGYIMVYTVLYIDFKEIACHSIFILCWLHFISITFISVLLQVTRSDSWMAGKQNLFFFFNLFKQILGYLHQTIANYCPTTSSIH